MNILLAYGYTPEAAPGYVDGALRRSHRVITCGPSKPGCRPQDIPTAQSAHVDEIIARLPEDFSVDFFLCVESPLNFVPRGVENLPCPTAIYQTAALWNHFWGAPVARAFDYLFVNSQRLDVFARAGNQRIFALKNACAIELRADVAGHRPIDVAFLGTLNSVLYPDRTRFALRLLEFGRQNGLNVVIKNGLYREQMLEVYRQSKIVFNSGFMGEGLNMRIFEAMVSGALALTDNGDFPGVSSYFQDGEHLALYDEKSFEDRLRHYLHDDAARLRVAAAGQAEVLAHHTYAVRTDQMLDCLLQEGVRGRAHASISAAERLLDLAAARYYSGALGQVAHMVGEAERIQAGHPELLHFSAVVAAACNHPDAGALFEAALTSRPHPVTSVCFGRWLVQRQQFARAADIVQNVEWQPGLWWPRVHFPHAFDFTRLDWHAVGISEDPDADRARYIENERLLVLAMAFAGLGDTDQALSHWQALAEARPQDAGAWAEAAGAAMRLGMRERGLTLYERAVESDALAAVCPILLAVNLLDVDPSAASVRRGIDILERNSRVLEMMVDVLLIGPSHPIRLESMNTLGIFYALVGRTSEACKVWESSLQLAPAQPTIQSYVDGKASIPAKFQPTPAPV